MFDSLCDILGIVYGVVHLANTPAVSVFGASEVDSVAFLSLAHKHAIMHEHRVDDLVYGVGDRVAVSGVKARLNAFAAREDKDGHSHTEYQGNSQ